MKGILDDSRLAGVFDVGTALKPLRTAELIRAYDLGTFYERIEIACQAWGGGSTVLVPSTDGDLNQVYVTS